MLCILSTILSISLMPNNQLAQHAGRWPKSNGKFNDSSTVRVSSNIYIYKVTAHTNVLGCYTLGVYFHVFYGRVFLVSKK